MLTYLKLLATMAFWGGTFVAGRLLAGSVPPFQAAFMRFSVAVLLLLLILYGVEKRFPPLDRKQLGAVALLGLTGVFGYNVAFFTGLQSVSAGRAGLIVALNPIGIALLSALFGGEPLRLTSILGIAISVIGAMLVISHGNLGLLAHGIGTGELTLLGCVLCWALYSVIGRRTMRGLSPLASVAYSALAGTLFLAPVALTQGVLQSIPGYSLRSWACIVFLAVFGTVLAFIWYYQSIKEIGAVRSGVFINFVPLFAMLFGLIMLGETLTQTLLQGGTMVVAGAWITNWSGKRQRPGG